MKQIGTYFFTRQRNRRQLKELQQPIGLQFIHWLTLRFAGNTMVADSPFCSSTRLHPPSIQVMRYSLLVQGYDMLPSSGRDVKLLSSHRAHSVSVRGKPNQVEKSQREKGHLASQVRQKSGRSLKTASWTLGPSCYASYSTTTSQVRHITGGSQSM